MAFVSETLTFDKTHYYNTLKPGLSLTAILHHGQESVECEARLDTGSSHCIFKRAHGELLGLDIESTVAENIGTVTRFVQGASSHRHDRSLGYSLRNYRLFRGR